jgi:hypothetical protein
MLRKQSLREQTKLALGELEAPPRSCHTVLFPLYHAWIACKVAVVSQRCVVCVIYLAQGA